MKFIKQNIAYIALAVAVLAIGVFAILPTMPSTDMAKEAFVSTVSAWGSTCGSCDDGGSTSSGSNNDRTDDDPNNPAVCKFLKVEGKGDGGDDKTVVVPYGTTEVSLRYSTVYATKVTLNGKELSRMSNLDGRSTKIDGDTTFKLVAENAYGSDTCKINIDVKEPVTPKCVSFNASPTWLPAGGGTTSITWETENADHVQIVNLTTGERTDVGDNNTSGRNFSVTENTTFRLVVYGADGSKDNGCEVPVKLKETTPVPKCVSFDTDANYVKAGDFVRLTWTTQNATGVQIKNITTGETINVGDNNTSGRNFTINQDTKFQLLVSGTNGTSDNSCKVDVWVKPNDDPKECELKITKSVDKNTAKVGEQLTYTINIKNIGNKDCTGGGVKIIDDIDSNLTFVSETHTSNLDGGYYTNYVYDSSKHQLSWNGHTLTPGESGTIHWVGKVKTEANKCSEYKIYNEAKATAYELNNFKTWVYSNKVSSVVNNDDCDTPDPITCEANANFSASPTRLPYGGGNVTLSWNAVDVDVVRLDGVSVANSDSVVRNINDDRTFILEITGDSSTTGNTVQCPIKVNVDDRDSDPISCEDNVTFTANPTSLPYGGGDVTLKWNTTDIERVELDGVQVDLDDTKVVNVNGDRTFTLEVKGDNTTAGNTDSCKVSVNVGDPDKLTCEDVDFTASDTSVREGSDVTLYWSWDSSKVYDASIDQGIGDVNNNGSKVVEINDDITYRITIENADSQVSCPLSINAESGGGGGGSSKPRCELDISDKKIKLGEEITLTWDTSRATEVIIEDDHGNVIVTTEDKLSKDKIDLYDGEITLKPTKDTKYTLNASRGSKDRECEVEVEVENNITVLQTRNQEPRVAGIALTQVPYTGFEAGPALTILFYVLLTLWALYVAYVMVIKRDSFGGVSFAGSHDHVKFTDVSVNAAEETNSSAAETYVNRAVAAPIANLPTMTEVEPATGYTAVAEQVDTEELEQDLDFTALENHAHMHKTLISSDAMRYFMATNGSDETALEKMTDLIADGKKTFPSEDGWLVLNLARLEDLMANEDVMAAENVTAPINLPTVAAADVVETVEAKGSGSLAEAIVTGNIVAAYQMIANRPMVALADAATDLDAVYRARKGEEAQVSDMLMANAAAIDTDKLTAAIAALTGALDGTYTDEAEAVKMAILKAVKAIS